MNHNCDYCNFKDGKTVAHTCSELDMVEELIIRIRNCSTAEGIKNMAKDALTHIEKYRAINRRHTMIKKYIKKRLVIEAVQYRKENEPYRDDFKKAICLGGENCSDDTRGSHIHTLEGIHYILLNDYIIKGIKGEFYPCKPDIFEASYDEEK